MSSRSKLNPYNDRENRAIQSIQVYAIQEQIYHSHVFPCLNLMKLNYYWIGEVSTSILMQKNSDKLDLPAPYPKSVLPRVSSVLQWNSVKVEVSPEGASSQLVWCSRHCRACSLSTDTKSGALIACEKCSFRFPAKYHRKSIRHFRHLPLSQNKCLYKTIHSKNNFPCKLIQVFIKAK